MRFEFKTAAVLALSVVALMPLNGQTSQGAISGTVTDSTGAVVGGARIIAHNAATGATSETVSSSAGSYSFPNLNAGRYDVTTTFAGFKSANLTGVVVQVGTTTSQNIVLQPGEVTESVTVTSDAPTVESETSDVGTVVTAKQVLDLPLALGDTVQAMRSPEMFVFLTPGTVGPGTNGGGSNGATTGGPFQSKITGGQNYATEVLLDGASM